MLRRLRWIPGALLGAARLADGAPPPPPDVGVPAGASPAALAPCGARRNCVRSGEPGAPPPIPYAGSRAETERALLAALATLPRTRIARHDGDYVRAECRSRVFRFVDDLELLLDDARGVVHVRSASRVGRDDFGVNRRRVAALHAAMAAAGATR